MTILLRGSPLRDEYKFQHKQPENYQNEDDWKKCQGFDLDFVEVRKQKIIAFTDLKRKGEPLTWIEETCYPLLNIIAPVLIIEIDDGLTTFIVRKFRSDKSIGFSKEQYFNDFLPNIEYYLEVAL